MRLASSRATSTMGSRSISPETALVCRYKRSCGRVDWNATASAFPVTARSRMGGTLRYSANRSSHLFISSECTRTTAPVIVPARAKFSAEPSPTSTTGTRCCRARAGAQASEIARTENASGAMMLIRVAPSLHEAGSLKCSMWTLSAPAALNAATPQSIAFCMAGVPGTRPPISSVKRRRFVSKEEGFKASAITSSSSDFWPC